MVDSGGEGEANAGHSCPESSSFSDTGHLPGEITINGQRLRIVQASGEELAAILRLLERGQMPEARGQTSKNDTSQLTPALSPDGGEGEKSGGSRRSEVGGRKGNAEPLKPGIKKWMATGAKVAGLVILAACVTGELSPEPHGGQNIHAHGGHENKRSVVLRPVVRRRSDGAAPEPLANDEDGMAGCENRVDLCEHRTDDGVCRRRERLCRWVDRECVPQGPPGKESSSEFLKMIDRKISAVQKDVGELRRAPHPACGHTLTRPVATLSQPMGEGHLPSAEKVEPASDDEARRLFALLKALETESYYRKAPVTRVFQLYCLEGLTRDKVAKKCRCAPSLVTLRLRAIESRLGRKASALRQISDHFDRIADALSDDRARHIHRPNALDDPGDDDDDAV